MNLFWRDFTHQLFSSLQKIILNMAQTKHTAMKSTPDSNDDDNSDLENKSTGDKRKQRVEFSEDDIDYI